MRSVFERSEDTTPHKLCPSSRHEIRHVHKNTPESDYFCVVFAGGRFRSVTDSRKKYHGTIPH